MSRSFPLLRANLQAVKDSVTHGDSVLWMGWLCLLVGALIGTAFFYLWKGLISTVVGNIVSVLPLHAGDAAKLTINVCLGLCVLLFLLCWAYSMCWIHADQATFRSGPRERLLAKSIPLIGAVGRIIGMGLGIAVVGWVLELAVASRFSFAHADLIVLGAFGLLLLPLTVRLWYLPTMAALENDNAAGPWAMLLQATNGRLVDLAATILLQALLLAASAYAFKIFVADLASPLYTVATSGDYTNAADYAAAIRSQVSPELLKAAALWLIVSGPILMLVAAMQVATVRFLVGVADEGADVKESHFLLADDGTEQLKESRADKRGPSADPLKPQFGQFAGPEAAGQDRPATTATVDESRELPEELVRAAMGEEASLCRLQENGQPKSPAGPPALVAGQFGQLAQAPVPLSAEPAPSGQLSTFAAQGCEPLPEVSEAPAPESAHPPLPAPPEEVEDAPPPLAPPPGSRADALAPPLPEEKPFSMPPPPTASGEGEPPRLRLRPPAGGFEDEIGELPDAPLDRFRKGQ